MKIRLRTLFFLVAINCGILFLFMKFGQNVGHHQEDNTDLIFEKFGYENIQMRSNDVFPVNESNSRKAERSQNIIDSQSNSRKAERTKNIVESEFGVVHKPRSALVRQHVSIPTYLDSCNSQYKKYLQLYPKSKHRLDLTEGEVTKVLDDMRSRHFKINLPQVLTTKNVSPENLNKTLLSVISFTVEETSNKLPTDGGTSFRIACKSEYLNVCSFTDHFNGTYSIFCPFYGTSGKVTIQLSHIDYDGYRGMSRAYDELIWRGVMMIAPDSLNSPHEEGLVEGEGLWTGNEKHHYVTRTGERLPVHKSFMCKCTGQFAGIYVIGASHLRNAYYCQLSSCRHDKVMRNVFFRDGKYMEELWSVVDMAVQEIRRNHTEHEKRLFILQTGSWDLGFRDFKESIEVRLPELMKNLSTVTQYAELLLIGIPSLPNESDHPLKLVTRSNEISAVFNKRMKDLAAQYGIGFMDMFSVTFPVYRERVLEWGRKTHHYIAAGCKGLPGVVALDMVFYHMCPDLIKNYSLWKFKVDADYMHYHEMLEKYNVTSREW